jgi:hypothetical protein
MIFNPNAVSTMAKIGRNQPCPCGSGKKYKRCHGSHAEAAARLPAQEAFRAGELIRQHQQGHGRPIIATKVADHQIVAVGNTIYYSKNWKTFPDFLASYIIARLGKEWLKDELAKPVADRHPIMQWEREYSDYQRTTFKTPGEVVSAEEAAENIAANTGPGPDPKVYRSHNGIRAPSFILPGA